MVLFPGIKAVRHILFVSSQIGPIFFQPSPPTPHNHLYRLHQAEILKDYQHLAFADVASHQAPSFSYLTMT